MPERVPAREPPSAAGSSAADVSRLLIRLLLQDEVATDGSPLERFEAVRTRVIDSLAAYRPLWAAQFEVLAQVDSAPDLRAFLADAMERGRLGLAELIQHRMCSDLACDLVPLPPRRAYPLAAFETNLSCPLEPI
jgi:hypothetical protein